LENTPILNFFEKVINKAVEISFRMAKKLALKYKRAIKTALEAD